MSAAENNVIAAGGCLCEAVRYRIHGDLYGVVNCHCSKCRVFHGNFGAYVIIPLDTLDITEERGLKWFLSVADETPNVHRGFCTECGSSLFWHSREQERIGVAAGSLDAPTNTLTIAHVWLSQKSDYYEINDDLPQFEKGWERSGDE